MLRWLPLPRGGRRACTPPIGREGRHARIWSEIQDANVQGNPAWHIGLHPRLRLTRMGKADGEEAKMGVVVVVVGNVKILTIK